MTVMADMTIECSSDGSEAVIRKFPAYDSNGIELTIDSFMTFLAENNVVRHIDIPILESVLQEVIESGVPAHDILVAKARLDHEVKLCNNQSPTQQELIDFVNYARNTYWIVNDPGDVPVSDISAVFVNKGQEVMSITNADSEDIYNRKISTKSLPFELKAGTNIKFEKTKHGYVFWAEKSGYAAVCPDNKLHIIPPLLVSNDKMKVVANLLPLYGSQDIELVIEAVSELFSEKTIANQRCLELEDLKAKVRYCYPSAEKSPIALTVAKGQAAVEACPGKVNLFVQLDNRPADEDADRVDYTDFTSYCMVEQDQEIAEVFKPTPGIPGMDVTGQKIEPEKADQLMVKIGERIFPQEMGDKQILIATDSGCLIYGDNKISVTDSIIIPGNVGPETGKIEKGPSSVIIKGNILSGYSVECDETLIVEGSIEAGAKVRCNNLTVYKGVFGHKSDILVSGDAEVGYIQSAAMRVLGNLSVDRYIMESEITCRGNLVVDGRGLSGKERGAVIGGNISVLGSARLHSIGSESEHTNVACGIDTQINEKLKICKSAVSAYNTEAAKIQKSIGLNLADPNVVEKLKDMPDYRREEISGKLGKVKEILTKAALYEEQCQIAQAKAFAPDLKTVRIKVENHLVPMVNLAIGECNADITQRLARVSVRISGDELAIESF